MYDNIGYIKHGLITTPHAVAKTPDYYITGDDIRIYPGEKFTAENTASGSSTSACSRMAIMKAAWTVNIRNLIYSRCCRGRPTTAMTASVSGAMPMCPSTSPAT